MRGKRGGNPVAGLFSAGETLPVSPGMEQRAVNSFAFPLRSALLADHRRIAVTPHRAFIRFRLAGQDPQERGFPRPVLPDKADPLSFPDGQRLDPEQFTVTVRFSDIPCFKNHFCHEKTLPSAAEE